MKSLNKQIFIVSVPIILQNLINSAVSSADVFMTGFVGQASLSALSLANQFNTIAFMFFVGINSAVTMLCSQYWGKGDLSAIEKVEGIAYRVSLAFGIVLGLCSFFIPEKMMLIYTPDPELVELGASYLRATSVGYIFWALSTVYLAALRSIQRVVISTVAESSALVLNVFLNACFIFGLMGLPRLGLRGIGLATAISRFAVFILCALVSIKSPNIHMNFKYVFKKVPALTGDFFSMAVPAVGNEVGWAIGFSMYSVVFGHLGSDVVAANSLVTVIRNLSASFCWGIGTASGIIVGQYLGAGQIEEGKSVAKVMLKLATLTGVAGGLLILLSSPLVVSFANITDQAKDYLTFMLRVNSVYIIGTAVNATLISGILRSGGDAKWGFRCDMIGMWLYGVPLSFLAAFVFKLPVKIVYLLMCTDEFVKWPAVLKRFKSGRWARNITRVIE